MQRAWQTIIISAAAPGLALALSGCERRPPEAPSPRDPIVAAALQDPPMTEPDLASQNQPGAVFVLTGPASAPIPLIDRSDDEVAAARAGAARLLVRTIGPAPEPAMTSSGRSGATLGETAAHVLSELRQDPGCAARVSYTAAWGAAVPPALPIYPRGHLIDAAGTDGPGCRLRAVTYLTPVAPRAVIDFYWNRAGQAQLIARHEQVGPDTRVVAGGSAGGFAAYVRPGSEGTAVTLVTAGL